MSNIDDTKAALQEHARKVWHDSGRKGTIAAGTGAGKTKIAIDEVFHVFQSQITQTNEGEWENIPNILIIVPTERLRDTNWPDEFGRWYPEYDMIGTIRSECYASLAKVKSDVPWDLVIFDEVHHLTVGNSTPFFQNNLCMAVMGLTATPPKYNREPFKYELMEQYCPIIFRYSLDQGVDDGIIADFRIMAISNELETVKRNIPAGTKAKPFKTTEFGAYNFLINLRKRMYASGKDPMWIQMKLNRFLYDLPSKTALAFEVIRKVLFGTEGYTPRTIIFCGSIAQCETLCKPYTWHSTRPDKKKKPTIAKPVPDDDMMDRFNKKEFNAIGVVDAANEGQNIVDLDCGIMIQCKKSERELVQRIGRIIRKRPGHVGKIYLLYTKDTEDESWVRSALEGFDSKRITWVSSKQFLTQDLVMSD